MSFLLSLLTALLPALADKVLGQLRQAVNDEMDRRGLTELGVKTQVAADNEEAAVVERAIGQAGAQPVDIEGRLKDGAF